MASKASEWVLNSTTAVPFCHSRIPSAADRWIWIGSHGEKSCKKKMQEYQMYMFDETPDNVNYTPGAWQQIPFQCIIFLGQIYDCAQTQHEGATW